MSEAVDLTTTDARPVAFPVADDLTLRGDAWGAEDAPPLLLLHGGGQTRHSWAAAGRCLGAEGWRALALDLRGHGESDWAPDGSYQYTDFVDDIRAVIRLLGRPPVVVGASLGGMTGLMIGGGPEPRALSGLVLVDVAPRIEPLGVARIVRFMMAHPEGFASLEEAADAVAVYRRHRARPGSLAGLRKNLRRGDDGRYRWHWDPRFLNPERLELTRGEGYRFEGASPLLAAARRLEVPTLLVRGRESDVVSPEGVDEFLAAVPHAAFSDVSGAGHMVAGDRNDAFNAAVLSFLREAFS